jgi:hypothetical protein
MKTHFDSIQRQCPTHVRVNRFHGLTLHGSAPNIRLVRGDDEKEASALEFSTRFQHAREDRELTGRCRGIWFPVDQLDLVNDTIAIEKDGA